MLMRKVHCHWHCPTWIKVPQSGFWLVKEVKQTVLNQKQIQHVNASISGLAWTTQKSAAVDWCQNHIDPKWLQQVSTLSNMTAKQVFEFVLPWQTQSMLGRQDAFHLTECFCKDPKVWDIVNCFETDILDQRKLMIFHTFSFLVKPHNHKDMTFKMGSGSKPQHRCTTIFNLVLSMCQWIWLGDSKEVGVLWISKLETSLTVSALCVWIWHIVAMPCAGLGRGPDNQCCSSWCMEDTRSVTIPCARWDRGPDVQHRSSESTDSGISWT